MASPSTVANLVPPDEAALMRRLEEQERALRELSPAIMATIGPAITLLREQQTALAAVVDDIAALVADLGVQQAALAARVSLTTTVASFNTGALPNDATTHWYGAALDITVPVPTGRLLVMVGCAEASLNPGGSAVEGICSFSIPGVVSLGDHQGRNYLGAGGVPLGSVLVGTPLILVRSVEVPPGTHTVTGRMGAWVSGSATASVNFANPFMTVQVTA